MINHRAVSSRSTALRAGAAAGKNAADSSYNDEVSECARYDEDFDDQAWLASRSVEWGWNEASSEESHAGRVPDRWRAAWERAYQRAAVRESRRLAS